MPMMLLLFNGKIKHSSLEQMRDFALSRPDCMTSDNAQTKFKKYWFCRRGFVTDLITLSVLSVAG